MCYFPPSDRPSPDPTVIAHPTPVRCTRVSLWGKWFSTCPICHASIGEWDRAGLYEYHHPPVSGVGNTSRYQNHHPCVLSPALFIPPIAIQSARPWSDDPCLSIHVPPDIPYKSISVVHLQDPMAVVYSRSRSSVRHAVFASITILYTRKMKAIIYQLYTIKASTTKFNTLCIWEKKRTTSSS